MKKDKITPILLVIVLVLLLGEFAYAIYHQIHFQAKIEDGNARWHEVENVLHGYEERIKELEELCDCGRNR